MKLPKSYAEARAEILKIEGEHYPGKSLVDMELRPGYDRAIHTKLWAIKAIQEAHLVMLAECGIVPRSDAQIIIETVESIDYVAYHSHTYSGKYEDLFFEIEDDIIRRAGSVGGNLHLARSRNDMGLALARMVLRTDLFHLIETLIRIQHIIVLFAEEHFSTLYIVHTHTQHAQPGILGHYFLGVVDVFQRNIIRLQHAYDAVNSSPLGAAAITTTGFPISREMVARLLGFSSIIENSYDAIGNCDFFTETAADVGLCALDIGRVITDLLLWATEELAMIRVADGYISTSSIMPQKRNPIALEHLRSSLSQVKGLADTIQLSFLKTPYGDISDYEDTEETMARLLILMESNLNLFGAVMATLDVDKNLLEKRAHESFSVVTEIADELYRSYSIPFRLAHKLVASMVRKASAAGQSLSQLIPRFFAKSYEEVMGRPFSGDLKAVMDSIDPWRFVVTREVLGGTGPKAMQAMLQHAKEKVSANINWCDHESARLEDAARERQNKVDALRAR